MTDVFLSYAREDQASASELVRFLEEQGFSVSWDRQILPGENWERMIEHKIRQTRCVIVLWTPNSVASEEVRAEARFAKDQEKLLPVLLGETEVPLSYGTIQYCDLRDWDGGEHPSLQDLYKGIRAHLIETAGRNSVAGEQKKSRPGRRTRAVSASLAWLILPTLTVACAVVILMLWRASTEVEVNVVARLVRLRAAGTQPKMLLEGTTARSLAFSGFDRVTLRPANVWIADPAQYDITTDSYPAGAWSPLPVGSDLTLSPADRSVDAAVTIEPKAASAARLSLDPLYVADAEIVLRAPEKGMIAVQLAGSGQHMEFSLPEEFQMDANYCVLPGRPLPFEAPSVRLRVRLSENSRILGLTPGENGVRLDIQSADHENSYLAGRAFPIVEAEFLDLGPSGEPASTIAGSGTISYVKFPNFASVRLKEGDYLRLGNLDRFYLNAIAPAGAANTLRIGFHGVAGRLASGPSGYIRDRRLTQFDKFWQNSQLVALFTIIAWLVATLVAARKLYREMRRA